ncbi:MAG: hypothetical protein HYY23_13420 [Verrucomicrobia bacterium]|nr:hypothetical protein [Verrucomicrobiota bacterium]
MKTHHIGALGLLISVCALARFCEAAQMALKLEGDPESYFAAPDHRSLDGDLGTAFTAEAWVKPAINTGENMILNKEDAYELGVNNETFQTAIQPKGAGWEWWNSEGPVPVNSWTHVAVTWDGSTIRTFVNGQFLKSFDKAGVLNDSPDTFKVGRRTRGGDTHSIFTGLIDEVRISKVIRYTEAGFPLPKTAFTPDGDTVALYHFDEAINGVVKDASGFANHGTLINSAVIVPADTPLTTTTAPVDPLSASVSPSPGAKAARYDQGISVIFVDGTTKLAPNSVALELDGAAVTGTSTKQAEVTTVSYVPAQIFAPNSAHTAKVTYKDDKNAGFAKEWSFTVENYNVISASAAVKPDTSKKGFIVRTWKSTGQPNNLTWTEEQLAGLHGDNEADTSLFTDKQYGKDYFDETGTINYWNSGGQGNFTNNDTQNTPGLVNDGTNDDNYSLEIVTYLDLPAGTVKMGVNSDDGFRVSSFAGDPRDQFATRLGQFEGGRGVADTVFTFVVEKAGVYPFRMIYEEGGGASAVEWFSVTSDNVRHLINDANDAKALKAYRPVAGATPAYVSSVTPPIGSQDQSATPEIKAVIVDGVNKINPASVTMTLDGAPLKVAASKAGDTTTATFSQTTPFAEGTKHTVTLTYADTSTPPASRTVNWDFSTRITEKTFVVGTLFIEAEDFNYGHGKYIKDKAIGMSGKYPGGAYKDLGDGVDGTAGDGSDLGIDYFEVAKSSAQAIYRPGTGVEAGKPGDTAAPPAASLDRGTFSVEVNHVVGWNDAGDWYNYTRTFPTPAKDYDVYAHLASGGADEAAELAEITGGATTATQTKVKLGTFKAKATGNWDVWHIVQLKDDEGNPLKVNLGGERTLRFTVLPGALDVDYLAFVPAAAPPPVQAKFSRIRRDAGNIILEWTGSGTLQGADDVTGPWADVGGTSPKTVALSGTRKFYRIKQ